MYHQGFIVLLVTLNVILVQSRTTYTYQPPQQPDASQSEHTWVETLTNGVEEAIKDLAPVIASRTRVGKAISLAQGVSHLLGLDTSNNNIVSGLLQQAFSAVTGGPGFLSRNKRDVHADKDLRSYGQNGDLFDYN